MTQPIDLSQLIAETGVEIQRLDWTPQKAKEYLIETYGKKSRNLLTEEELLDFLRYLKYLPTPESKLNNPINNQIKNPVKNLAVSNNPSSIEKNANKTTKTITNRRKRDKNIESIDLSEIIALTDYQMERIDWTPQQGREYLIQTFNKRGRTLLTQEELLDFLQHLESIPTPYPELSEKDPLAGF